MSIATLLSQHHQVTAVDIIPEKVDMINNRKSPIRDDYIEKYLAEKELNLTATLDAKAAYSDADFVVIAAPTNYDSQGALAVQDVELAYELPDVYFHIQTCDDGFDYTLYNKDFTERDGGILETDGDNPSPKPVHQCTNQTVIQPVITHPEEHIWAEQTPPAAAPGPGHSEDQARQDETILHD